MTSPFDPKPPRQHIDLERPRGPHRGLREAHAHLPALGESLSIPSASSCVSMASCLEIVRERARDTSCAWIRVTGARVEGWSEQRWPTISELDEASGGKPCIIKSFDHHAAVANSAALKAAGLAGGDRVGPSGLVCADDRGHPTGFLVEHAALRVWHSAPCAEGQARLDEVRRALEHLCSLGYGEVHDMLSPPWLGEALAALYDRDELPLEVWMYGEEASLGSLCATRSAWERPEIRLGGLKMFADGTLNSRTAQVSQPYAGSAPGSGAHGRAITSDAELERGMRVAGDLGVGVAVHAIGDVAVARTLRCWERVHGPRGAQQPWLGPIPALRVEHAEILGEAEAPAFARMNVVCSVQPCHLLVDIEVLERALPTMLGRVFPLRELIDAGCKPGELLWFGSDTPVVWAGSDDSIVAATERRRKGMPVERAIGWGQRMTVEEAYTCFKRRD